jgi:hypothetical protein
MTTTNDKKILQKEVDKLNKLLPLLHNTENREQLLRRRRSLLRIIHDVPTAIILPLDWQP